ncbi:phage head closure protein [Castellaniella sp.]|uniref:phage head closure protein n=1 Tax=Castellaniella sp. TaxID=1955812 RepID=UPI002AFF405D|nr:phage head closure protein [Castellaniella sp.]
MQAGKLTRRIEIQRFTQVMDPKYGPQPGAWETLARVWASIAHLSGLETVKQGMALATVQASIRARYRSDVNSTMRVLHGAKAYDINAVLLDEQNREFMDLICTTGATQ